MDTKTFFLNRDHDIVSEDEATIIIEVDLDKQGKIIEKRYLKGEAITY
jgi:hypothetical protein